MKLEKIAKKGKPIILSTGMSTPEEIDGAVKYLGEKDLIYFRGDNPYVYQTRGNQQSQLAYLLTYFWLKSKHSKDLSSFISDIANLKAKFFPKLSLISLQNLAASAPSIIL